MFLRFPSEPLRLNLYLYDCQDELHAVEYSRFWVSENDSIFLHNRLAAFVIIQIGITKALRKCSLLVFFERRNMLRESKGNTADVMNKPIPEFGETNDKARLFWNNKPRCSQERNFPFLPVTHFQPGEDVFIIGVVEICREQK